MMKLINHGILFGALALGLVACSDEAPWDNGAQGEGGISLRLSASADVSDAVPTLRSTETLVAPAVESFGIRLEKSDGSYLKEWGSLNEFNSESFRVGTYTLTAFNGDINEEGFEKPCFMGSTEVTVLEARKTDVEVTATLANTMVSIEYTDAFKSYFKGYSGTLHSEGHSYVAYAAENEGQPAYLCPGMVDITVQVTDSKDRTVTVQPAKFDAQARHHYHVTIDVKGGQGNGSLDQLVVSFDDSVDQESVIIDLTDELFTSKAPEVTPAGFENGEVIEHLEGVEAPKNVRFDVIAMGGIESATLTVNSATYTPSFGKEFDLMTADTATQAILTSEGISAKGFWHNPDRMAFVDLTEFCKSLPAGRHEISLVVKDKFTRVSEPVTIIFDTNAVNINVVPKASVFGSNQAVMAIDYNGTDLSSAFNFQAQDDYGQWQDCKIASSAKLAPTRALPVNTYNVTITLPASNRKEIPVRVFYRGKQVADVVVPVVTPEFDAAYDAFAHSVVVKVTPKEADMFDVVTGQVKVYVDGAEVAEDRMTRDRNSGIITVKGFDANKQYKVATSFFKPEADSEYKAVSTEAEAQVPNGNLSAVTETINITDINTGGQYTGTIFGNPKYWIKSSITASEATGWASLNQLTCWTGSTNMNTWFVVPSTFVENGVATIRSVGYSHNGTTPGYTKETAVYYSKNAAVFQDSEKVAGEMFLGSYTFDGSAHRVDGIDFSTRPASLSFHYEYAPLQSENGYAEVKILDKSDNVIASANKNIASGSGDINVALSGYKFGVKAAKIIVRFKSSTSEPVALNIPSGSALKESSVNAGNFTNPPKIAANTYKAVAIGSVLKVSDIKLNY